MCNLCYATRTTVGSAAFGRVGGVNLVFVAPQSGMVTADTVGSDYDTVLTGDAGTCPTLTALTSRITFAVTAGTTYILEVTDYAVSNGGTVVLNLAFAP